MRKVRLSTVMDISFDLFEYYMSNGFVDYIIITITLIIFLVTSVISNPIKITNFYGLEGVVSFVPGILIIVILLLVALIFWPLVDGAFIYFFHQYTTIFVTYLILRLLVLLIVQHQVYTVLEYIFDTLTELNNKYLFWIWELI